MSEQERGEVPLKADGQLPWWRNDPWLGRHLFWANHDKNLHLLEPYDTCSWRGTPTAAASTTRTPTAGAGKAQILASGDDTGWYVIEAVDLRPQL